MVRPGVVVRLGDDAGSSHTCWLDRTASNFRGPSGQGRRPPAGDPADELSYPSLNANGAELGAGMSATKLEQPNRCGNTTHRRGRRSRTTATRCGPPAADNRAVAGGSKKRRYEAFVAGLGQQLDVRVTESPARHLANRLTPTRRSISTGAARRSARRWTGRGR